MKSDNKEVWNGQLCQMLQASQVTPDYWAHLGSQTSEPNYLTLFRKQCGVSGVFPFIGRLVEMSRTRMSMC